MELTLIILFLIVIGIPIIYKIGETVLKFWGITKLLDNWIEKLNNRRFY